MKPSMAKARRHRAFSLTGRKAGNLSGADGPHQRRHPLFGWMRGTVTIAPGVDLVEPAYPEWADIAEESIAELARMLEEARGEKSG
jgi:hypothetical protein